MILSSTVRRLPRDGDLYHGSHHTARHLPPRPKGIPHAERSNPYHLPRPVIIDSALRFSPDAKLLKNYREGRGRRPWIICSEPNSVTDDGSEDQMHTAWSLRLHALEKLGARVINVPATDGTN